MLSCRYIFGIYDFDESGVLSVDETILALRSTIAGLCKLCGLDPPLESEIEAIALMVSGIPNLEEQGSVARHRAGRCLIDYSLQFGVLL